MNVNVQEITSANGVRTSQMLMGIAVTTEILRNFYVYLDRSVKPCVITRNIVRGHKETQR